MITKKFITFSKVKGPYKYHFQILKGLELRLFMPGVFLTPMCHRRVKLKKNSKIRKNSYVFGKIDKSILATKS